MNPQDNSTQDHESLSALLDGELGGEARRFAMRRLAHDTDWQQATGRWQMIGDAMRRQAPIAAPADFAERVRGAIAAEAAPASSTVGMPMAVARPPGRAYRWAGAALAASVALAAVIGLRPEQSAAPGPVVASTAPSTTTPDGGPTRLADVGSAAPGSPVAIARPAAPSDTATVTARSAPDRAVAVARIAVPTRRPAAARGSAGAPTTPSAPVLVADAENPFRLKPADDIAARPWPRAALTGASEGAFTARYGARGQSAADAPSFYPFEPRLEGADGTTLPGPTP